MPRAPLGFFAAANEVGKEFTLTSVTIATAQVRKLLNKQEILVTILIFDITSALNKEVDAAKIKSDRDLKSSSAGVC